MMPTLKQFFNIGFTLCCAVPMGLFVVLYAISGDYRAMVWQTFCLLACCIINAQCCMIKNMRESHLETLEELREELQINIALIKYMRKLLPAEPQKEKE